MKIANSAEMKTMLKKQISYFALQPWEQLSNIPELSEKRKKDFNAINIAKCNHSYCNQLLNVNKISQN